MSIPVKDVSPGHLRFTWVDEEVIIEASRFHDGSKDVSCELRVLCTNPVFDGRSLLHWGNLNMAAASTRKSLAKELTERWNIGQTTKDDAVFAWDALLLQFITETVNHIRQGEPMQELWSDSDIKPLRFLVGPIVPEKELTVLLGDPGSGKSYLSLSIGICVQCGLTRNSLGLSVPKEPVNVLYLDYETSNDVIQRRLALLSKGLDLPRFPIRYRRCYRPLVQEADIIQKLIKQNDIGLLIVDSLGFAVGAELKEAEGALALATALRQLNVTTLVVAHPSKGNGEGQGKSIYGSVFFTASARQIFLVKRYGEKGKPYFNIGLSHEKTNDSMASKALGYSLTFEEEMVTIHKKDVSDIVGAEELMSKTALIKSVLGRYGAMTIKELCEEIPDLKEGTARQTMNRLRADNEAMRQGEKWVLISTREEALF